MEQEEMKEIEEAKNKYIEDLIKNWCNKYEKGQNYGLQKIKELIQLTEQQGIGEPIPQVGWPQERRWGVGRWWRYSTGIIERKIVEGRVFYFIRPEFFEPLKQVLQKY